jgi:hypothetical protein
MSSFTDDLLLTELAVNWRVEKPFVYEVGAKGSGRAITVPLGFVTDGASVPQFL